MLTSLLRKTISCVFLLYFLQTAAFAEQRHFPHGAHQVFITNDPAICADTLHKIAPIIENSIAAGNYPGAVVLAAHHGKVIYRGVFGNRRIVPDIAPMQFNTIFDIASLTKVVATTPAIMQLIEQKKLKLDAPVAKYWPAFANHGKEAITIRELLTHTSGLPAGIPLTIHTNPDKITRQVANLQPINPIGKVYLYSDVNFFVLGYLVQRITGKPLDQYAHAHIFKLLAMKDTTFKPSANLRDRIAPTEILDNQLRWGETRDPAAYALGGVSGNAGVFSTASDLAIYTQCLLNKGHIPHSKHYLLHPQTIAMMTRPQEPAAVCVKHGLGWDIDSPYSCRGKVFSEQSFGHSGWTGTSIWTDPVTQTWLIVLASRSHPTLAKTNQLVRDRRAVADLVAGSVMSHTQ